MGEKRCHKVVTFEKKLDIINELKKGKLHRLFSTEHGISKLIVADIWKQREK